MDKSSRRILASSPRVLARIMAVGEDSPVDWRPEEMGAILRHQLDAPLAVDLEAANPDLAKRLREVTAARPGSELQTFADVFGHTHVPVQYLEIIAAFAQNQMDNRSAVIPREIARVLFDACLALALTFHGRRLSAMPKESLTREFEQTLALPWIGDVVSAVIRQGLRQLTAVGA